MLRQLRRELRASGPRRSACDQVLEQALETVRRLDIPHLDVEDEGPEIVH
jgi:hypothetical protein